MNADKLHVARIDFVSGWGDGAVMEMCAVFDDRDITEDEAWKLVQSEQYSDKVLVLPKAQFLSVSEAVPS